MKKYIVVRVLAVSLGCLYYLVCFTAFSQEADQTFASVEFISNELSSIINKNAKVEIIAEGLEFTEGPLWVPHEKMLLFSDIPANTIYKWTESGGHEMYLKPAGYTGSQPRGGFMGSNGLYLTDEGKLWICQHGDGRIAEMDAPINEPEPKFKTIADNYQGKRLNSPNDLFMASDGTLYFTDPAYGFEQGLKDPQKELPYQGVYKMDRPGEITLLIDSLSSPNGIAIFPDGKTLLVSNTMGSRIWYAYDIDKNGLLENGRIFFDPGDIRAMGGCDGLKIDKEGNVFATGPGGVWIFSKEGKLLGKINVEGRAATNCALTPDGNTLFITATQYVLRIKMR